MYSPENPSEYIGPQLIANTEGRIVLNAADDLHQYSNRGMLFSTNGELHFNTSTQPNSKFIVESPKIQLGVDKNEVVENPAVLGNELVDILNGILDIFDNLYNIDLNIISYTSPAGPVAPDPALSQKVAASKLAIENLRTRLGVDSQGNKVGRSEFHSSKVHLV
jgi:hypothetical protein